MRATVRQLAGQAWQKQDELDVALLLGSNPGSLPKSSKERNTEKSVARTAATSSLLRTLLGSSGLQRLMYGHNQPVPSVALSDDGKTLASGDMDGVIRLWTADGLSPSRELDSEFIVIYSVALSPDGELLAACGKSEERAGQKRFCCGKSARPHVSAIRWRHKDARWRLVQMASGSPHLRATEVLLWSIPDLSADQL